MKDQDLAKKLVSSNTNKPSAKLIREAYMMRLIRFIILTFFDRGWHKSITEQDKADFGSKFWTDGDTWEGCVIPDFFQCSTGNMSLGNVPNKNRKHRRMGEWFCEKVGEKIVHYIALNHIIDNLDEFICTLVHELAHAIMFNHTEKLDHGPAFKRCMAAMGVEYHGVGKGQSLMPVWTDKGGLISQFIKDHGKLPHIPVRKSHHSTQPSRLVKVECTNPDCPCTIEAMQERPNLPKTWTYKPRCTSSDLIRWGAPYCPACGQRFTITDRKWNEEEAA